MRTAGVAELKARFSEYLARIKAGEEVLITERGRPIARLLPLAGSIERDSRQERLIRKGLLIPGRGRFRRELLEPPPGDPSVGSGVLAALLEERREGR